MIFNVKLPNSIICNNISVAFERVSKSEVRFVGAVREEKGNKTKKEGSTMAKELRGLKSRSIGGAFV